MLAGIVCSPPFADSLSAGFVDRPGLVWGNARYGHKDRHTERSQNYGLTPGQLGALKAGDSPMATALECEVLDWHGCYDGSWKGILAPAAFAHPAKFAHGLITRILRYGLEQGFWEKGSVLGDPFAGVGCGGIIAAYEGLRWVGVELEPRFVGLAEESFALHRNRWEKLGCPPPQIVQGDSRRFAEVVRGVAGVVASPPYANTDVGANSEKMVARRKETLAQAVAQGKTGPRFAEMVKKGKVSGHTTVQDYGQTPGQIGALPAGDLGAVVTSPPYVSGGHHADQTGAWGGIAGERTPGIGRDKDGHGYGVTEGQIGLERQETYWSACAQVYASCRSALRSGGVMAVVVKDYVKKRTRVPLCDQTAALLSSLGFTVLLRCRSWLTREEEHAGLFGAVKKSRSRKSFFRRLAESKGSPRIDWEEVLWARV